MKFLINLLRNFIPSNVPTPVLGRWRLENCKHKTNFKVDLSNEDHCGPCGQYALQKVESKAKNEDKENKDSRKG